MADPDDGQRGADPEGEGDQEGGTGRAVGDGSARAFRDRLAGSADEGVFGGSRTGSLVKVTSAGASGSLVSPGQTIDVTITWNPRDFGGFAPFKTVDCVELAPEFRVR